MFKYLLLLVLFLPTTLAAQDYVPAVRYIDYNIFTREHRPVLDTIFPNRQQRYFVERIRICENVLIPIDNKFAKGDNKLSGEKSILENRPTKSEPKKSPKKIEGILEINQTIKIKEN